MDYTEFKAERRNDVAFKADTAPNDIFMFQNLCVYVCLDFLYKVGT